MLKVISLGLILLSSPAWAGADRINIANFSSGSLQGWEEKEFDGKTQYNLVTDIATQQSVLKAYSAGGASGLFREMRIDLKKTPYLQWSWKTESSFQHINENEKDGDDFVARIYVVIDGGYFFWKTLALNYVWSSSHQQGERWDNPYTANATMVSVQSGSKALGVWKHYKRNVYKDLKSLVGKDIQYIDAIAVMTDSDNAHQAATTYFGDIFFTSQ